MTIGKKIIGGYAPISYRSGTQALRERQLKPQSESSQPGIETETACGDLQRVRKRRHVYAWKRK